MILFKNANVVFEDRTERCNVLTGNGKIIKITNEPITADNVIDCTSLYLAPGFIDLHVHGGGGCSLMDESSENIKKALLAHANHGTTSILPTMLSSPEDILIDTAKKYTKIAREFTDCNILGVHFEGPYLSPYMSGAQNGESILPVNENSPLLDVENLKMITVAPELPSADILAKKFRDRGVTVAAGHTCADFDEMEEAVKNGFSDFTHLYNASVSSHKEGAFRVAGAVEAALTNDGCTVQVIGDLRHLPLGLVRLIYKCKGAEKAYFITDGLEFSATNLTDGDRITQANGVVAVYKDGVMMTEDLSRLAGSASSMDILIKNAVEKVKIPLVDAVKMASSTPARVIGVDTRKGYIRENYDADIVLFDEHVNIKKVMVNGKIIKE